MIPFAILSFLSRLPAIIVGPAVAVIVLFGAVQWNQYIHDPVVRRAALKEYVAEVTARADREVLTEMQRQKSAGDVAIAELNTELKDTQAARDAASQKLEQEIASHEKLGVNCPISQSDIDWLHK